MKRFIIYIIVTIMGIGISRAQVSGYSGDRMILSGSMNTDAVGWIFPPGNFTMAPEIGFEYVITRKSSLSLKARFDKNEALYHYVVEAGDRDYYYSGSVNAYYNISSTLLSMTYKTYINSELAPIGGYGKYVIGLLTASHDFDRDYYYSNLGDKDYDQDQNGTSNIIVEDSYAAPYLGVGFGENYPLTDFLLLYYDFEFRVFFKSGNMLGKIFGSYDFDYSSRSSITEDNMIQRAVLTRSYIHSTIDVSLGLMFTF